jgi:arginyl-tRNA synthetase
MSRNNNASEAEGILDFLDMIPKIEKLVTQAVLDLYGETVVSKVAIEVTVPADMRWGDYTTNVSMLLGPVLKQSPLEIAKKLQYRISQLLEDTTYHSFFGKISVASPGYINIESSNEWLQNLLVFLSPQPTSYRVSNINPNFTAPSLKNNLLAGKKIMVEYTDPNPFKVFHIGHLMPNTVGECLARMFEFCGAEVRRASYQGDVGMHVAKSIWGMLNRMAEDNLSLEDLEALPLNERMLFLGKCYVAGAEEYKRDSSFITQINALVYVTAQELLQKQYDWQSTVDYKGKLSVEPVPDTKRDALIKKLYEAGRSWSLAYFETLYEILGTKFDYY